MVVVSEHELIELEQQFARIQNIPITDPYLRVPIEKKAKHRPALLSETLKQWRFMVYFEYLYFDADNLFIKHGVKMEDIHLQIKLFKIKNDFPICLKEVDGKDPYVEDSEYGKGQTAFDNGSFNYKYKYDINLLRVYYYFSETVDIKQFLSETELQIRFTYGKDWNNYIAQGSTKTLSHFDNYREKGQKHESRVYMFLDSAEYCTVKLMAGLVCDGDFNTASMNLHKYNGVYFPNDDFYN